MSSNNDKENIKLPSARADQKLKPLCVLQILKDETDVEHPLSRVEIEKRLQRKYGIIAERKGIYKDLAAIENFLLYETDGIESNLQYRNNHNTKEYYLAERLFTLSELKLLTDIVQSSQVISNRQSKKFVEKLKSLASDPQKKSLNRNLQPSSRIKTAEETNKILEQLNQAILADSKISCDYFQWNYRRKQILKNEDGKYILSPWELVYDDGKYYLVAYKEGTGESDNKIKHYRVDKMKNIRILEDQKRIGKEEYKNAGTSKYDIKMFGMFSGKDSKVHMLCDNWVANPLVDRFGKDIYMRKINDKQFEAIVDVSASTQFYAWIIGLGDAITITAPEHCVKEMKKISSWMYRRYGADE